MNACQGTQANGVRFVKAQLVDERLLFLDGLRGVAILLVVAFHAYARWPELMPYGSQYASIPFARYGHLGVQLFFLISGFVIFKSLARSPGLGAFLAKRWLRLFPAMLVCSLILLLSTRLVRWWPRTVPALEDILPGLLLIDPVALNAILGTSLNSLDDAFWTLYVEVQFYLFVACCHFWKGRRFALIGLAAMYVLFVAAYAANALMPGLAWLQGLRAALAVLGAKHYPWFLVGALLYCFSIQRDRRYLALAVAAIMAVLPQFREPGTILAAAAAAIVFGIPVCTGMGTRILSNRILLVVGLASYPLYLLHQNLTIAAVAELAVRVPSLPSVWYPIAFTVPLICLGWLIATRAEPCLRVRLSSVLILLRPAAGSSKPGPTP
jgi:peptidoglycan/LPS O-acetylase OafA/YrhL